jgi:hypothetical protein
VERSRLALEALDHLEPLTDEPGTTFPTGDRVHAASIRPRKTVENQ